MTYALSDSLGFGGHNACIALADGRANPWQNPAPCVRANALNSEQIAPSAPPLSLCPRGPHPGYEPGQWAIGRKCVYNEEFFCGHFPGQPVMPGVLILEALAQTGAVAALACRKTQGASWPCSAVSKMPASASRSPPVTCSPCTVNWWNSAARWAWQSLGLGGRQCAATAELTFAIVDRDVEP